MLKTLIDIKSIIQAHVPIVASFVIVEKFMHLQLLLLMKYSGQRYVLQLHFQHGKLEVQFKAYYITDVS